MSARFHAMNCVPNATRTMFVFPHAGSGPTAYVWLCRELRDTQLYGLSLPGRGARLSEPPLRRMEDIFAGDLMDEIDTLAGDCFAFFGHSMGGWVAHEAARRLAQNGHALPQVMHLSASRAPTVGYPTPHLHRLPRAALLNHVTQLAQVDGAEVLNDMIFELLEPTIRSDFEIMEHHEVGPPLALDTELHCYVGAKDPQVTPKDVVGWQDCTGGALDTNILPGGHFYFLHELGRRQLVRHLMQ